MQKSSREIIASAVGPLFAHPILDSSASFLLAAPAWRAGPRELESLRMFSQ
jgi:hypothetical protein